jgi:hypothetical protein
VYETYDGVVVTLLDERESRCSDPNHVEGNALPGLMGQAATSKMTLEADRQRKS